MEKREQGDDMARENVLAKGQKETNRPIVLAAVMISMFMTAVESTIVGTAMPSIVSDLGGFSMLSWVFSAYLLAQAITVPIYGKMSDLFGRKLIFVIGVSLFLVGSFLSGFSQTMTQLIFFRIIQGLGAGAVQPIATTIIGDIYTLEERAKIQGYLSSVWGISAVIGPLLGALFVQIHWSWIFWINLPLGLMAMMGILSSLHEVFEKKKHEIDYLGSLLLFVMIISVMLASLQGGTAWSWLSWQTGFLLFLFLLGFFFFFVQERKAKEPIIPLHIWKNRTITFANLASLTTGGLLIGISSFLPTHLQGAMGYPPLIAGFALTAMSIGWPFASFFSGKMMIRYGFRTTSILGGGFLLLGSLFFLTLTAERGAVWAGLGSFFTGMGMGFSTTSFIVSIQSGVPWNLRGVATSTNLFMRTLGGTVGAAFLGGVLNTALARYLYGQGLPEEKASALIKQVNELLDPEKRVKMAEDAVKLLQGGLEGALHGVYWGMLLLTLLSLLFILLLPKEGEKMKE
nr:MDR family MFS transporter [Thermicanus aegyptius]